MRKVNSFKIVFILYFTFIFIYSIISIIFTQSTDYHNLSIHKSIDVIKGKIQPKPIITLPVQISALQPTQDSVQIPFAPHCINDESTNFHDRIHR